MLLVRLFLRLQLFFLPLELLADCSAAPAAKPDANQHPNESERHKDARFNFRPDGHQTDCPALNLRYWTYASHTPMPTVTTPKPMRTHSPDVMLSCELRTASMTGWLTSIS